MDGLTRGSRAGFEYVLRWLKSSGFEDRLPTDGSSRELGLYFARAVVGCGDVRWHDRFTVADGYIRGVGLGGEWAVADNRWDALVVLASLFVLDDLELQAAASTLLLAGQVQLVPEGLLMLLGPSEGP